jgi:CheY-like chemotaxis protein
LVVEDRPELRLAVGELLRELLFRVRLAADGFQAVEAASREEPDVVLMDLRLPGVDGLEAVRQIKTVAPLAQFVVHSWSKDEATTKLLEDEGIFRYIVKGAPSQSIVEALEEAVAHKRELETDSGSHLAG